MYVYIAEVWQLRLLTPGMCVCKREREGVRVSVVSSKDREIECLLQIPQHYVCVCMNVHIYICIYVCV